MKKLIENLTPLYRRGGIWPYLLGTLIFYFALQYIDSFTGIFFLCVGALLAISDPLVLLSKRDASRPHPQALYIAWAFAAGAVIFYLLHFFMDLPVDKLGGASDSFIGRLRVLLLFLFLLAYGASLLYRLTLSLSYGSDTVTTTSLQVQRQNYLKRAVASGLAIVFIVVLANYLTYLRNPSLDLSPGYFSLSENSRRLIRRIDREVQIHAFLPELQAVRLSRSSLSSPELYQIANDIRVTLEHLPLINAKIKLEFHNADLEAYDSNEFGNINNGTIVCRTLKKGTGVLINDKPYVERRVYANSKDDLSRLERDMVKALVYVAAPQKKIYFTAANGERYGLSGPSSSALGIETLKEQLRFYNLKLEQLDQNSNWPGTLPADADLLAIIGPTVAFGEEAREQLSSYLKKGGALFISINPQGNEDFSWLLGQMGGKQVYGFAKSLLTNTNLSGLLLSDNFQEHSLTESIKSLSSPVVMPQQSYFESQVAQNTDQKPKPDSTGGENQTQQERDKKIPLKKTAVKYLKKLIPKALLYSPYNSYIDANKNNRKDAAEKSGKHILGLAYEKPNTPGSPRVVIFSGTEWLSERGMRFPIAHRNSLLAADSIFWLIENPLTATLSAQERPARNVQVTEELKWKLLVFGMILFPVCVGLGLGFGLFYYRRKRAFKAN